MDSRLLDTLTNKYELINDALNWAKIIKRKENSAEPMPNLIRRALMELVTGQVTPAQVAEASASEEVAKASVKAEAAPGVEEVTAARASAEKDKEEKAERKSAKKKKRKS